MSRSDDWSQTKIDNMTVTLVDDAFDAPAVTTDPRDEAHDAVLAGVGAWPRDAMNTRTIAQVESGDGSLDGWNDPLITSGLAAPADVDRDGMPDDWENEVGLDVGSDDSAGDIDEDGWTNLEEWLHIRASALIGAG